MIYQLTPKNLYDVWSSEFECIKVLDFRPSAEYLKSRIPGAKSFSKNKTILNKELFINSSEVSFFLIDAPEVVRKFIIDDHDIENVFEIEGGFKNWVKTGYPTAPLKFNFGDRNSG